MDFSRLLADRTKGMEASAIREILKVASSPDVISLAGGLPAAETFPVDELPDLLRAALDRYGSAALQYDASEGFGPLREALVPHLAARGVTATADDILITSGSQGALDGLGKVLLSRGDIVAVEAPTYLGALQAFNPYQPAYVEIETDDDGLVPVSLDRILEDQRVKFVYAVPTFQNPTGRTLSMGRRRQVAEILQRHDALLVEDDPYSDLRYVGEPVAPVKSLAPDHVVYLSTLSKTFAPGLRVGLCVAPVELQRWLVIARQGVDLHTTTLSQALAAEYIRGGLLDARLPATIALYRARRQALIDALEAYMPEGFRWTQPEGGMFIWVTGPRDLDTERLYAAAIARGVAFVPGRFFFADPSQGRSTLRMNFTAAEPDVIREAIRLLADAIHETSRDSTQGVVADER
ncbi:MAG: aminotransferase class I/II-fold pyridoxal phosphate-dependent enzyme [Dehalococcoidia bacterium]|nr:aminotransferase class I/II-fold pyridoxal phosphate-dependent enzyme [Dehalococcoidia bacterium]